MTAAPTDASAARTPQDTVEVAAVHYRQPRKTKVQAMAGYSPREVARVICDTLQAAPAALAARVADPAASDGTHELRCWISAAPTAADPEPKAVAQVRGLSCEQINRALAELAAGASAQPEGLAA